LGRSGVVRVSMVTNRRAAAVRANHSNITPSQHRGLLSGSSCPSPEVVQSRSRRMG
jgi:hypothetical protein